MRRCLRKPRIALYEKNLIWTPLVSSEPPYYEPEEVYNLLFEADSTNDHSHSNSGNKSVLLNDKLKKKRKRRRWNKAYDHQNTRRRKKPASKALEMMDNSEIQDDMISTSELEKDLNKKLKKKSTIRRKDELNDATDDDEDEEDDDDDDDLKDEEDDDDSFVVDDEEEEEEEEDDAHSNHADEEEEKKISRPGILNVIRSFFGRRDNSSSTNSTNGSNDRTLNTSTNNNNNNTCDRNNAKPSNGHHQGTSNGNAGKQQSQQQQHRRQAITQVNGNSTKLASTASLKAITPLKIRVKRVGKNGQLVDSSQPVFSIENNNFAHSTPITKVSPPILTTFVNGLKRGQPSPGSLSPSSSSADRIDGGDHINGGGRKSPLKLNGGGGSGGGFFDHCRSPSPTKMSNGKL